jgi:hypothetical protein
MSRSVWLKNPIFRIPPGPGFPDTGYTCVLPAPVSGLERTIVGGTTPDGPPGPSGGRTRGGSDSPPASVNFFGSAGTGIIGDAGGITSDESDPGAGVGVACGMGMTGGGSIALGCGGRVSCGVFGVGTSGTPGGVIKPAGATDGIPGPGVGFATRSGVVTGATGPPVMGIGRVGADAGPVVTAGLGVGGADVGVARTGVGGLVATGTGLGEPLRGLPLTVAGGIK